MKEQLTHKVNVQCMTYNQSSFIKDTLDGFAIQETDFSYVCVIIDDASTDGEPEILMNYLQEHFDLDDTGSVRQEETDDFLLTYARHRVNKNCYFAVYFLKYNHYNNKKTKYPYWKEWVDSSQYIALCEGDDYWIDASKLHKQVSYMDAHPSCSMCCHNAYIESADTGRRVGIHTIYSCSRTANRLHVLRDGGFLPTASLLYRNALFTTDDFKNFPQNKAANDIRIQGYAAIVGDVYYLNEVLSVYRLDKNSVTHRAMTDKSLGIQRQHMHMEWYREVDNYTHRKFHDDIDKSIAFCEARILRLEGKYFKLWNPRYLAYLGSLRLSTRIGLIIGMCGLSFVPRLGKYIKQKNRGGNV